MTCPLSITPLHPSLGAEVAGVDLIETSDGCLVIEVNAAPGFDAFEEATGIDVTDAILLRVLSLLGVPPLD